MPNQSNLNSQSSPKTPNMYNEDLNEQLSSYQHSQEQVNNNNTKDNAYSKSLERYIYDPNYTHLREEQGKDRNVSIKDSPKYYAKRYCHYSSDNNDHTNTENSENSTVSLRLSSGVAFSNGIDKLVLCFINIALLALTVICFIFNVGPSLIDNISVLSVLYFLLSVIFMLWLSVRLIKKD